MAEQLGMDYIQRQSKSYIDAVIKKKSQDDPKEMEIRRKTADSILREPWANEAFYRIREIQIEYLKEAVAHVANPEFIHRSTQETIREIASLLRTHIVEGSDLLAKIPKRSPVLIATNHLGAYKLCGIKPKEDVGVEIPGYDAMYPYLMYFAALAPIADALEDNIYYVSEDFPGVFGNIHSEAGFIHIPPASISIEGGRTDFLTKQTAYAINKHSNSAIVNLPEGGTSGKYSNLGIYDLDPFKTGGYVVAAKLGIHIVPVAQYFDKDDGMQLRVFEPFIPLEGSRESYEPFAAKNRADLQMWLNEKKDSQ